MDIKTKISLFIIASITIGMATANINSFAFAKMILPEDTSDGLMHLTEALKALRTGDVEEASMHLTEAVKALKASGDTSDGLMHLTEALKALRTGDVEEASMHLTEAIESF
jgi:cellobiose-specific phosphotransferase system component IIA